MQAGMEQVRVVCTVVKYSGMYFTSYAEYALRKYAKLDQEGFQVLLVCWILSGNPYPAIEDPADPMQKLFGKKITAPHDANYVLVNAKGKPQQEKPFFDEFCIDQESQVVPRFVLFIKKF